MGDFTCFGRLSELASILAISTWVLVVLLWTFRPAPYQLPGST
jgi:hypothetical protein